MKSVEQEEEKIRS